jgi:hypothetical protein
MGRPTKIVSPSDGNQTTGRQQRPAPALKPINYDQSARSSPAIDYKVDVANQNWTQTSKGVATGASDVRPGTSAPPPMFQVPPVHPLAWLHSGGLFYALQQGFQLATGPGVAGQPDKFQLVGSQYPVGYVLNDARNQSVSPDSTVKEEEIKLNWQLHNSASDKEGTAYRGGVVVMATSEDAASGKFRKRTGSRSSDCGGSSKSATEDVAAAPFPKLRVVDDEQQLSDMKICRPQLETNVGLDLRRRVSRPETLARSPENEDNCDVADLTVSRARDSSEENYSVSSCVGRIGKVYRRMGLGGGASSSPGAGGLRVMSFLLVY